MGRTACTEPQCLYKGHFNFFYPISNQPFKLAFRVRLLILKFCMLHFFSSLCVHVPNNISFFLDVISGPHYKVRSSVIVTLALRNATDTFAQRS